ncbi:hypothetical protein ACFL43_05140, partial [Thermodesulfobacteriota bacterium]
MKIKTKMFITVGMVVSTIPLIFGCLKANLTTPEDTLQSLFVSISNKDHEQFTNCFDSNSKIYTKDK